MSFSGRSEEDLVREEQEHLARQEEEADGLKMREREDWDMSRFGCSLNEIYVHIYIYYRSIPKIFLQLFIRLF